VAKERVVQPDSWWVAIGAAVNGPVLLLRSGSVVDRSSRWVVEQAAARLLLNWYRYNDCRVSVVNVVSLTNEWY
jgi:hypothetical protein